MSACCRSKPPPLPAAKNPTYHLAFHGEMRWPPWSTNTHDEEKKPETPTPPDFLTNSTDSSQWTSPDTLIPTAILTGTILLSVRFYRSYLRRIPNASNISASFYKKRSLFGKVTSVGDGDGFRLFHTPGGRLTGWGWLPWRKIPKGRALKDRTVWIY